MKKILIIGATSGIGRCLAELYSTTDARIAILGRRADLLSEIAATNREVFIDRVCDITQTALLPDLLDEVYDLLGGIDLAVVSSGTGELNPELDYGLELPTLNTNVVGWTCVIDHLTRQLESQGHGHLVAISSIGGLRGNGIAPAYNASKAFQINYLEGLRQRVKKSGKKISVTDIRPGLVNTAMAKGEGQFWVAPVEKVAKQIIRAIERRRKVAYVSRRWRIIACILKCLPS